jgi:hypothetical protein
MKCSKNCPHCGRKIRHFLQAYSSGDGCLSLTWREETKDQENTGRVVTKKQAERYLDREDNADLKERDWLPVFINNKWVLARHVKRIGPNKLRIGSHTYFYEVDMKGWDKVELANLTTTFKVRVGGKWIEHPMVNQSLRMAIRYFLVHETELKPFFKDHKQGNAI